MVLSAEKKMRMASRRAKVAHFVLQGGLSAYDIAIKLGMEPKRGAVVVYRDMKFLRASWLESAVRDFDQAKAIQLAKLEHLEAQLWKAWEKSQTQHITDREIYEIKKKEKPSRKKQRIKNGKFKEELYEAELTEKMVTKEERSGNPSIAREIRACIECQNELLGLTIKAKDGQSSAPPIFSFEIRSPSYNQDQPPQLPFNPEIVNPIPSNAQADPILNSDQDPPSPQHDSSQI